RYLAEHYNDPFTLKFWRSRAEELAVDWLADESPRELGLILHGAIEPLPETPSAGFRYPARGGFERFFAPLFQGLDLHLGERAVELDTGRRRVVFATGREDRYDALASSIPLPTLAAITTDLPRELREQATRLRHTQLLCVNLVVDEPLAV